jgi:hypothetical protein
MLHFVDGYDGLPGDVQASTMWIARQHRIWGWQDDSNLAHHVWRSYVSCAGSAPQSVGGLALKVYGLCKCCQMLHVVAG